MKIKYNIKPISKVKKIILTEGKITIKFKTIEEVRKFYKEYVVGFTHEMGGAKNDISEWAEKMFQGCKKEQGMLGYFILENDKIVHEGYDRGSRKVKKFYNMEDL